MAFKEWAFQVALRTLILADESCNQNDDSYIILGALADHEGGFMNTDGGFAKKVRDSKCDIYLCGQAGILFLPDDIIVSGVSVLCYRRVQYLLTYYDLPRLMKL